MSLRMDDEQDAMLTTIAQKLGVSKNEAALQSIVVNFHRIERQDLLEKALSDTMTRYSTTLKRLGE